jgi:hypothetical protein
VRDQPGLISLLETAKQLILPSMLQSTNCPCGLTQEELVDLQKHGVVALSTSGVCLRHNPQDMMLQCGRAFEQHPSTGTSLPSPFDIILTVMFAHMFVVIITYNPNR